MNDYERKYDFTKEQYIAEMNKIMEMIDWLWLLEQFYRFALNMIRATEYETKEESNN